MVAEVGGEPPPGPLSDVFEKIVSTQSKRIAKGGPLKFVKQIEDVPVVSLPPEDTICVALSLEYRVLIWKFTGLWPSPKTT